MKFDTKVLVLAVIAVSILISFDFTYNFMASGSVGNIRDGIVKASLFREPFAFKLVIMIITFGIIYIISKFFINMEVTR